MQHDLNLYNVDALQELYAIAFWRAYKVFPRANSAKKVHKQNLIKRIIKLESRHANGN
jgi:hypothetical protein